jgi:hypothetical protein
MPITGAGLNALPKHLNAHGSAVTNTVRQIAGAIGTALVITIMTTRTSSHTTELMAGNPNLSQAQLLKEASILGTSDAYMFTAILSIFAFILTLVMPNNNAKESE